MGKRAMTTERVQELLTTAEMMVDLYEDPAEAAILASALVAAVERRTQQRLPWIKIIDEFHQSVRRGLYRLGRDDVKSA
jgi:hypothetical protein